MKYITTYMLLIIVLTSCNHQKIKDMATTENEKIIKQYYEHFNNHEWSKMAEMYIDTSDFKDPSLGNETTDYRKIHRAKRNVS